VREQPRARPDPALGLLDLYDPALPQVHGYLLARCPDRALAGWSRRFRIAIKGVNPRTKRPFIWHMFHACGGGGASPAGDGWPGGGEWQGEVVRVSDWYAQRRSLLLEPLQFNDVRTLECIVQIDPSSSTPRIGQRVRVTLEPAAASK